MAHHRAKLLKSAAIAGVQSASIMTLADMMTQLIVEQKALKRHGNQHGKDKEYYDALRTLRWSTIGLTLHGPYFFFSFRKLDGMFGAVANFTTVVKKTAIAQLAIFPPYLVALFTYLGTMESGIDNMDMIKNKVILHVPGALVGGCLFWPIANSLNFSFISARYRVPYLATVGGIWNGYLSWTNAKTK